MVRGRGLIPVDAPPLLVVFAVPGALETPTGGYAYARALLARFPAHGVDARVLRLADGFPDPSPDDVAQAARALAAVPPDTALLVDGLALGAMPPDTIAGLGRPVVALVHHPLGLESGLPPERAARLLADEAAVLAHVTAIVVTSPVTARTLVADLGVPEDRIVIAEPGTAPAPQAVGSGDPSTPALLAVGAISPRKGFDLLIAAAERIADRPWRLTIVGPTDRAPQTYEALVAQVARAGLGERIRFTGALDTPALEALYASSDVFVSSSLYEGYGMVLAEALARGLPIVASTGGAAALTVPDDAALKVPPGDVEALAAALAAILDDASLRPRLARASREAGRRLPTWDDTASRIADTLRRSLETSR